MCSPINPGLGARCALVVALLVTVVAQAATMPNAARQVSISAREQPIGAFLQDLFAAANVPASVNTSLTGTVNGTFSGAAERVLRDVSRVYNMVTYFDGAVMHVVPASDLVRRTFTVAPSTSERVLREAVELGLTDARNTVRSTSSGNMIAVGTPRFVEQLDELVRARTAAPTATPLPAGSMDFRVFYLRYAWAQDTTMNLGGRQVVLPGVASILRSLVGARSAKPIGSEVQLRPTQPRLGGKGLASQGASTQKVSASSARTDAADALVAALARTAQPQQPVAPLAAPDPNQVRIEADPRLNAIIVRDVAERLPRYEQLIAALDVEPQSLEIEATIIDVNTDKLRELGVNWRWSNASNELLFGNGTASDQLLRNGQDVTPIGRGGIVSAVLGSSNQFVARINALQAEGAARVVSSPQVVTLSDVEAVFDNSSTFFVRVAGREQVDLFNVSAGTSLRVTPHVFQDKGRTRIKLMVNIEDGSLSGRQVDQIPVVDRSTINTQALITEGESLLIGGLVRDTTSSSVDKVPGLGDLPVIGNLFKSRTKAKSRIERMFLITPRLAGTRPAIAGAGLSPTTPPERKAVPTAPVPPDAHPAQPVAAPVQLTAASEVTALPAHQSIVLDLDAPLPGAAASRDVLAIAPASSGADTFLPLTRPVGTAYPSKEN